MKYLSLFSGIGGFEVAIHNKYKNAKCIAYSEINSKAINIYQSHFPNHINLGDIKNIKKDFIVNLIKKSGSCDLIVAGFPCNDLSSNKSINRNGLDGNKSSLFYQLLRIIKIVYAINPNVKIIIENNASMANKWRDIITDKLTNIFKTKIYLNKINSGDIVLQRRNRYYWTLNEIPVYTGKKIQSWKTVLDPPKISNEYICPDSVVNKKNGIFNGKCPNNGCKSLFATKISKNTHTLKFDYITTKSGYTRWKNHTSDNGNKTIIKYTYPVGNAKCITTDKSDAVLIDRRNMKPNEFVVRYFTPSELNRLFGFPNNYIKDISISINILYQLYGMTVVVPVIEYILNYI
jgi:DNA-cytosine methyltransferase